MSKTEKMTNADIQDAQRAAADAQLAARGVKKANANMNAAFAKGMTDELAFYAKAARKRYEEAQAKFTADVQTNPASAIAWDSEPMVKAQAVHEVWARIEAEMAEHDPREVLVENAREVHAMVRRFFGSNSTSLFTNACERAKAEALNYLAEELDGLVRHFGL